MEIMAVFEGTICKKGGLTCGNTTSTEKGIKSFVFVRDNKECCFGPGAALYDCLIVKMKKGKSATFTVRPIAVEGEFSIKPYEGPDGNTWAIFQLTDSIVD